VNVVLIGFSGSGKSAVGRALAERLGWEFADTDREVEIAAGKRIHEIFAEEGEAAFRQLEREAVVRALKGGPRVVAVGGGAVVDAANRQAMEGDSLIVLLEAEVETLHRRLAEHVAEEPRPMLEVSDPQARIATLKAARGPAFRAIADAVVHTDGLDAGEVAARVADLVLEGKPGLPYRTGTVPGG
jgi:shikimate kinase